MIARLRAELLRPGSRYTAVAAAGVGAAVDVVYDLVAPREGTEFPPRVVFIAAFIGVMAALLLAGAAVARLDERFAQVLLCGASAGYLLAGLVGIFSIGAPLVIAASWQSSLPARAACRSGSV